MTDAYTYLRFSTPGQADGDSLRRQADGAERFIKEHNLQLKESTAFHDLGVSSFRGANLRQGLGRFIAEVDAGRVSPGSYLIVESVDRLSRQGVMDALQLLLSLIEKGIRVVTLTNGFPQVLDKQADFGKLVITLGAMYRANEESETKRMRGTAVWRNKKLNAGSLPVTSRGPEWLTYDKSEKRFVPVPERVATIQKIFELSDQGVGHHRIVKLLNSGGYKSFRNPQSGWQHSSVAKLLRNRSLIGFYQPRSVAYDPDSGKETRINDGAEVADYYPSVIDSDLFRRVSTRKQTRVNKILGRQGSELTNLFTGMVFCMWCGSPMNVSNKGRGPKGGRYLVCSSARRGNGCKYRSWRYDDIELLILLKLRELDISSILSVSDFAHELETIRNDIAKCQEELSECQQTIQNLDDSISQHIGKIPAGVMNRWAQEEEREARLKSSLANFQALERSAVQRVQDPADFGDQLIKLYDAMETSDPDQNYLTRVQVRERLGVMIDRILIRPLGRGEPRMLGGVPRDRLISIRFRNGTTRAIVPIGKNDVFSVDAPASTG